MELTRVAAQALRALGYVVALNKPYAGGYITEHYGRPSAGQHALQVEVNRALYMDETSFEKLPAFEGLCANLEQVMRQLMDASLALAVPRAAAE